MDIESFPIHELSVSDRLALIERLRDSLPKHVSPKEVPEWHLPILAHRRALAEKEPGIGTPWREVMDSLDRLE